MEESPFLSDRKNHAALKRPSQDGRFFLCLKHVILSCDYHVLIGVKANLKICDIAKAIKAEAPIIRNASNAYFFTFEESFATEGESSP